MTEGSQQGCTGSANKLQRQRKGPWGLGEGKAEVTPLGEGKKRGQERHGRAPEREGQRSDFKNEKPTVTGL